MTTVAEMFAEQGPAVLSQGRLEELVLELILAGQNTTRALAVQLVYRAHPAYRSASKPGKMPDAIAKPFWKAFRRWEAKAFGALKKHEALGRIRATGKGCWEVL